MRIPCIRRCVRRALGLVACGAALLVAASICVGDMPARQELILLKVTATVEAVDYETREVTLKSRSGRTVTFIAGPEVKRLAEVKVGDQVEANYRASLVAELREPTAAEREKPLIVIEAEARADKPADPSAAGGRKIRAVTTIEEIDREAETISIKGPRGRIVTVHAASPDRLAQLKVGQTIVITYTEAVAIALVKTAP